MGLEPPPFERHPIVDWLMEHRSDEKNDLIARLIAGEAPPAGELEWVYQTWCRLAGVSIYRSDLERVRAARRRELNRSLFEESR